MRLTYLLINIFILVVPLLLSFDRRNAYYRHWPALGFSIAIVSTFYLIWDALVTSRGEWSFNPDYLTGARIGNLPIEEVLFFVTVPFSCLFIYEAILYRFKESGVVRLSAPLVLTAIVVLGVSSAALRYQGYTSKALGSCAFFLAVAWVLDRTMLRSKTYWIWLAICYVPFFLFNAVLTALPVVQYNPAAIFGFRVSTIPIEDFFYNFSMLSFYLLFYRMRRQ